MMTRKFKSCDKMWVRACVVSEKPDSDGELLINATEWPISPLKDLRPRVKRKKPASPWQPIESAPKDGTPVLLRRVNLMGRVCLHVAAYVGGNWMTDGNVVFEPTHYMLIPPLEVE